MNFFSITGWVILISFFWLVFRSEKRDIDWTRIPDPRSERFAHLIKLGMGLTLTAAILTMVRC